MAPPPLGGPHTAIKRELLIRVLERWLPTALHGTRRTTYLDCYATGSSVAAALPVFADLGSLLTERRLGIVLVAAHGDDLRLTTRVAALRQRIPTPPGASVQIVPTAEEGRLPALRLPPDGAVLVHLDAAGARVTPDPADLAWLVSGRRTQGLLVLGGPTPHDPEEVERYRGILAGPAGALVAGVELVAAGGQTEVVLFRTATVAGLEVFKDALWALDEYAGVRLRDPRDTEHALVDIALSPQPGPLRRAVLRHLAEVGARTVADLRGFALAETIYRAADVVPALTSMVAAGTVRREPGRGRLTNDVRIRLP